MKFKIFEGSAIRDVYEKVKTADGLGTTLQKVGIEEYTFVVEIDEHSLRAMGGRAARNKNGRAVRGGLVARVTNRKKS
jgi:hypothetical protein